jgi:hypothetical protein
MEAGHCLCCVVAQHVFGSTLCSSHKADFQHFDYLNNKLYRWIVPDLQSLLTNDELQTNSFHSDFFKDYPNDASGTLMSPCPCPMDAS